MNGGERHCVVTPCFQGAGRGTKCLTPHTSPNPHTLSLQRETPKVIWLVHSTEGNLIAWHRYAHEGWGQTTFCSEPRDVIYSHLLLVTTTCTTTIHTGAGKKAQQNFCGQKLVHRVCAHRECLKETQAGNNHALWGGVGKRTKMTGW